ncbi:hypothetical protein Tco_0184128 [Tanacetum coccineum]
MLKHSDACSDLRVLQIGIRAKVIENQKSCLLRHLCARHSVYTDYGARLDRAFGGANDEGGIGGRPFHGAEEQPLPPVDSPTCLESLGYVYRVGSLRGGSRGVEEEEESLASAELYYRYTADEPVFHLREEQRPRYTIHPPHWTLLIGAGLPSGPLASYPFLPEAEIERLLYHGTTNSPSPQIHYHPTSAGERLVGYWAFPPPPLPPLPPSLYIPPPVDHRGDIPESEQPSCKRLTRGRGDRLGFVSTVDGWTEVRGGRGIRDIGDGDQGTWVDGRGSSENSTMTDLYVLLEDAQDSRSRIPQQVDRDSPGVDSYLWGRTLTEIQTHRDHVYAHETYLQAHQTQLQLQSTLIQTQHQVHEHQVHETRFQMQQAELAALRETDRRCQDQMVETLRDRRARQPGPEASCPDHRDASGDADSHI